MHVCASACVCVGTCMLRAGTFVQACVCVCGCVFTECVVCMSVSACVCVTTKTGQQWETKQCQAATLCSLITKWILYS